MVGHPLGGAIGIADIERHPWPDPVDPHRFEGMRERAIAIIEDEGRATCFGNICTGLFEFGQRMRGFEQFFMDMLDDEEIAEALLDKALELKLAYWARVFETMGDLVDVAVDTDDYGTQQSLLVSPSTWRRLIGPRLRTLNDFIHANSRAKVFLHSCGAVRELIPDLIDAGVDILNPVQVSAAGSRQAPHGPLSSRSAPLPRGADRDGADPPAGLTWDHPRGLTPLAPPSQTTPSTGRVSRSNGMRIPAPVRRDPGDARRAVRPARHRSPVRGVRCGDALILPLDTLLPPPGLQALEAASVGPSYPSYVWDDHVWALPIDTAAQVSVVATTCPRRSHAPGLTSWRWVAACAPRALRSRCR